MCHTSHMLPLGKSEISVDPVISEPPTIML